MSRDATQANWLALIERHPILDTLMESMDRGGIVRAAGRAGCSSALLLAAMHRRCDSSHLLVTAHLDEADESAALLEDLGVKVVRFPALDVLPGETAVRPDLLADRMMVVRSLLDDSSSEPRVIVSPVHALMQALPEDGDIEASCRVLRPGDAIDREELVEWLVEGGHVRVVGVEDPGEFAVRGDILDIFPMAGEPARIDLDGERIDSIRVIELGTMGSDRALPRLDILRRSSMLRGAHETSTTLIDRLNDRWRMVVDDLGEVTEQGRAYLSRVEDSSGLTTLEEVLASGQDRTHSMLTIAETGAGAAIELPVSRLPAFPEVPADAFRLLVGDDMGDTIVVCCRTPGDASRCTELVGEIEPPPREGRVQVEAIDLPHGFQWHGGDQCAVSIVAYDELLHRAYVRRHRHAAVEARPLDAFIDMEPGDYVVHREHGIALFSGLVVMARGDGPEEEFLTLEFARGAKLHVPAVEIELVQKYIGAFKGQPERAVLGGQGWSRRKAKAADSVRDLAAELLRVQAARAGLEGCEFPVDTPWQHEFESAFPWDETPDQLEAIAAVKTDMQSPQPMDRLLCGDVGFGKTEVAIRAAFKAIDSGRQVAVLVPTTVLAEQHEETFAARFAGFPFRVASLSRFKSRQQQRDLLADLATGQIDVLIGTHRILSEDVQFKDLGLVVIDEEQRFGVEHKQRLLQLRSMVDVLTMTATPIPRTLHMSMLGLRDISSLSTPPQDRRAIITELLPWNEERLGDAVRRELARGGQVFVVHNRVKDLEDLANTIRGFARDATVVIGHGQMPPRQLEQVMLQFTRGEADVLVSTTIIESGIDIPTANTMIIDEADLHGLADLHQLRGRVGRFRHRAYCYLVLPRHRLVSPDAMRRLQAVESFSMLGAGFRIALRDLEIRGAGNLLGPEQSGHIAAVGYELYCRLLEQSVEALREGRPIEQERILIDLGIGSLIPVGYVPDDRRRMDVYRRLARAQQVEELDAVVKDVESAYGPCPALVRQLIDLAMIRVLSSAIGVRSIRRHEQDVIFRTTDPGRLEACLTDLPGQVRLVGPGVARGRLAGAEVWWRPTEAAWEPDTLLALLRNRLSA